LPEAHDVYGQRFQLCTMNTSHQPTIWSLFWGRAGRVPLRQKIIGITVAPLLILGLTIAWWVSNQLGGWLSYLLTEERVVQAMSIGMQGVFIITALAALIGLGIASFLTWFLTRPILDMTTVARRVKNGDLRVRAPVWANDEIGELGRAFNDMIHSLDSSRQELETFNSDLQNRNHELAMLYSLSDMANQSFTLQETSAHGLNLTLENTGATAGLVITLSANGPMLAAQVGLTEVLPAETNGFFTPFTVESSKRLHPDDSVIYRDIQDIDDLPGEFVQACQQMNYRSLVIAPIRVNKEMLGLLVMFCPHNPSLTTQQQRLIIGICNQLGIALQNSQLWEELRYKEHLRAQLLNKVVSAQEEERRRISRELHDESGQALTSLLVQLKILEKCNDLDDVRTHVEDMRKQTAQTLQEIRRLAADLRPAALDDLGLLSALEGYIYEFSRKTNINVDFEPQWSGNVRLPHEVEIVLYRVIQESLTNAARHATATQIHIDLRYETGSIQVLVRDNGRGFNTTEVLNAQNRSLGILGMRERIELLGGNFILTSSPGQGTQVLVDLALAENGNQVIS